MSSDEPRKLIKAWEGCRRFGIPLTDIYRARKRGTIVAAEGPDVPDGLHFEEAEFERWVANRSQLQRQGRPKGIA